MFHRYPLSKLWKSKVKTRSLSKKLVGPEHVRMSQNVDVDTSWSQSIPVLQCHVHDGGFSWFFWADCTWCEIIWELVWWAVQELGREHCQYRNESLTPTLSSANLAQSMMFLIGKRTMRLGCNAVMIEVAWSCCLLAKQCFGILWLLAKGLLSCIHVKSQKHVSQGRCWAFVFWRGKLTVLSHLRGKFEFS